MEQKKILKIIFIVAIIFLILISILTIIWFSFMKILEVGSIKGAEYLEKCPIPEELENKYELTKSKKDFVNMMYWCCENYDGSHWVCDMNNYLYGNSSNQINL